MANSQTAIYLFVADEDRKEISISAFPADHPDYESYHMLVKEMPNRNTTASTSMNILRNVLSANGVKVILE